MNKKWSVYFKRLLWISVFLGVVAAMPLGYSRWMMEKTSKQVEFIFDFRDLLQIASYQSNPETFVKLQLKSMKEAGITTISVYESTLNDLKLAGRLNIYNESQAALLQQKIPILNRNFTYVLFTSEKEEDVLSPIIKKRFNKDNIKVSNWSFSNRSGLIIETSSENALIKNMEPDPLALQLIHDEGFRIIPRISDQDRPFDQEATERMLVDFQKLGVKRILFDGSAVKGFGDQAEKKSLNSFGDLLNKYNIGLAAIENLKTPQSGFETLANVVDYDVVRLYSLSENDAAALKTDVIAERFLLAAKDRNIRMFYLNGSVMRSTDKSEITNSLDNVYRAIGSPNGAIDKIESVGFSIGEASAFERSGIPESKLLKAVIALGAVAIITLLVAAFFPKLLLPAFLLVLFGSVTLYCVSPAFAMQGLALGTGISTSTMAMIWSIKRIDKYLRKQRKSPEGFSVKKRIEISVFLLISTTMITGLSAPYLIGLLSDITYNLRLEQFRGVSLLHLAPILLVSLYTVVFSRRSSIVNFKKLLQSQITVVWILALLVIGAVGYYYLSRTGNSGTVSSLEIILRGKIEQFFGVRPRTKEFLIAHPLLLLGFFLSTRYRDARVLIIIGTIGQLSIIDTVAHLHTPLYISSVRILLGLGLGLIIGLLLIVIWQLLEGRIVRGYNKWFGMKE
ncbi:DUF5693 family protein [Paenibacillus typhae]|uniref:Uncharacterized protein n=1 Tax=Paenibacillus typhae TaxID=1174501 RepID=A0A1G8F952_9BACL|nr:DUF5693 family protein [Paenibacillus typhae]SDH78630.1 hypothetical protein SAMN05216192_101171 [Paenibacillus typhae]